MSFELSSLDNLLDKALADTPPSLVLRDLAPGPNESQLDRYYRGAYRTPDAMPRIEYDAQGNLQLSVEPRSVQAELMIKANALNMTKITEDLEGKNIPEEERALLNSKIKEHEALNARLRGLTPYNGAKPGRNTESTGTPNTPRAGLGQRAVQAVLDLSGSGVAPKRPSQTYEAPEGVATGSTFTNEHARLLLDNLSTAAGDLREQVYAGAASNPSMALGEADAMIALRAATLEQLHPTPNPHV